MVCLAGSVPVRGTPKSGPVFNVSMSFKAMIEKRPHVHSRVPLLRVFQNPTAIHLCVALPNGQLCLFLR